MTTIAVGDKTFWVRLDNDCSATVSATEFLVKDSLLYMRDKTGAVTAIFGVSHIVMISQMQNEVSEKDDGSD